MTDKIHQRVQPSLELTREWLDFQLSPSRSAKDAAGYLTGMVTRTEEARQNPALEVLSDEVYHAQTGDAFDLYRPADPKEQRPLLPCLIFIHGGFWQEGSKDVSGFAAACFANIGWATCALGYPLTPRASLSEIAACVHRGIAHLLNNADRFGIDPARVVIAGHSAGGHLAAALLAGLSAGEAPLFDRIGGLVLISGVYELAPIARSYVNDLARITNDEIETLSPLRHAPKADIPVHLLIGADEPEAFQRQTDALADVWGRSLTRLDLHRAEGRDHFDVLDALNDPHSASLRAMLSMV